MLRPRTWLWQQGRAARGFTLIEALVAMIVLALSLSALFSAHNVALRGASAVDEHLQARLLAQSLLAQWTVSRTLQGSSRGQSGRFAWSVSVVPFAGPGAAPDRQTGAWTLHELTVTVSWPSNRRIDLTTLRMLGSQNPP